MSFAHVERILPKVADLGGKTESEEGSPASPQTPKMKVIGPVANKRVSRGLTRAVRRPSDYSNINNAPDHGSPDQPLPPGGGETTTDMMIATTSHRIATLHRPALDVDDEDDEEDDDGFESGLGYSPLLSETPIPPLPRARVPSRLGVASAHLYDIPEPSESNTRGMMLIGRPASTASYNRVNTPRVDHKRDGTGTPSSAVVQNDSAISSPITTLEDDLKALLLCQSMGVKIMTRMSDLAHGTTAQMVFHCPRCLKHWNLSGKPKPVSECSEPDQPTSGPEFNISNQSHQIIKELDKLPEESRQQLMSVLSRAGSPGADEELLELVNSTSSLLLREQSASTSPHASRRSRSPEKRSVMILSGNRDSPSPVEKSRLAEAGFEYEKRSRSARQKGENRRHRQGTASAGAKPTDRRNGANQGSSEEKRVSPLVTAHCNTPVQDGNVITEEGNVEEDDTMGRGVDGTVTKTSSVRVPKDVILEIPHGEQAPMGKPGENEDTVRDQSKKRRIPYGERCSTGQTIVEFQDIDGAQYHGFMSHTGTFVPIARIDSDGNRVAIAMKPSGGYCAITKSGYQSLSSLDNAHDPPGGQATDKGIIELRDKTGQVVRGYRDLTGKFIPIARISEDGIEQAVMMRTDGKYYVQDDTSPIQIDLPTDALDASLLEMKAKVPRTTNKDLQTAPETSSQLPYVKYPTPKVIEIESHDGYIYQGFHSPGYGFVPTARIEGNGERRPVVVNAEGRYTVVDKNGTMIEVSLGCLSPNRNHSREFNVCQFIGSNQALAGLVYANVSSSTSSQSSEGPMISPVTSVRVKRRQKTPEIGGVLSVERLVRDHPDSVQASSRSEQNLKQSSFMTFKRSLDGSVYHGRCHSDHFEPIFRLDEKGYRYPVLKTSDGRSYTIDFDGKYKYIDESMEGADPALNDTYKTVLREINDTLFEGRCTIDGRFVPISRLDKDGNRQAVVHANTGQFMYIGQNGNVNFMRFPEGEKNITAIQSSETSHTSNVKGEDGFIYEGYCNEEGKFIPTVRVHSSGNRQVVLRNSQGQGFVIGFDGKEADVPFKISKTDLKKIIQKSRESDGKGSEYVVTDEAELSQTGAITQSSHLRIMERSSHIHQEISYEYRNSDPVTSPSSSSSKHDDDLKENMSKPSTQTDAASGVREKTPTRETPDTHDSQSTSKADRLGDMKPHMLNEKEHLMSESQDTACTTAEYNVPPEIEPTCDDRVKDTSEKQEEQSQQESADNHSEVDSDIKAQRPTFKEAAQKIVSDLQSIRNTDQRDTKSKQVVKNTAVRNVTGRPDTRPGQIKKHIFATPEADLTKTLSLGNRAQDSKTPFTPDSQTDQSARIPSGSTKLPSLPQKPQLPDIGSQNESPQAEASEEAAQSPPNRLPSPGLSDRATRLPSPGLSDRANTLPPVEHPPRGSRAAEKVIQKKKATENRRRASKVQENLPEASDITPDKITADSITESSPSSSDLLSKFSRFKLTTDQPVSPPLLTAPSDRQQTYRMAYSTLPSHLRSPASPVVPPFSPEQSASPELALLQKRSSVAKVSTLPDTYPEFIVPAAKVSSRSLALKREGPKSGRKSRTSISTPSPRRLRGPRDSVPHSVSKIWQQHHREMELLRQTFQLSLTTAFTFSMFELPVQYAKHNKDMREKARQIRTMKRPTRLGKPPKLWQQKKPQPLSSIKKPARQAP